MKYENNLDSIVKGLNEAADIITSTMGAEGKTVAISENGQLRFTKDGVSVARKISFENEFENIGAKILISAANKTVQEVGDGTTLTSLLLKEMINFTLQECKTRNINEVLNELKEDIDYVLEQINTIKQEVTNKDQLNAIASISSNSEVIGKLFEELYEKTSLDSLIKLEKSQYTDYSYFESANGVEFRAGFMHPAFMTDKSTEECIYENPLIIVDNEFITNHRSDNYKKVIQKCNEEGVPLIIMAPNFSDAFVRVCTMFKVNNDVQICLVKIPGSTQHSKNKNVEDIKSFLNEDGGVDKIVITPYDFTMYNDDTPYLQNRLDALKVLKENAVEWWEEEDYEKRFHNLKSSTAIIYAGGKTEESLSEEYDRIEDAIGATQAAIKEGYVEGGGITLYKLDTKTKLLKNIIRQPFLTILDNANVDIKMSEIDKHIKKGLGYNVKTKVWEKFDKVIDPTKVLTSALENAFSNTKLIVNTSYVIHK